MLDIGYIRDNAAQIAQIIADRHLSLDLDEFLRLDEQRRALQQEVDELRAKRNSGSKGKPTADQIEQMKALGATIKEKEDMQARVTQAWQEIYQQIPNLIHPDSPRGGEADFVVRETKGTVPTFQAAPKDHETILTEKSLLDFERGAKVVGSKFFYTKGDLVRLNRALLHYGMDIAERHGFTLIETPDLARQDMLVGAGFNPRGEETQIYNIENTDLSLIGTAEITTLGYHAGEVLDLSDGPKKYAAISHCFRTEAGAYGRTSRGLYRVHQFSKLELFVFCTPEQSDEMHEQMLTIEQEIMDGLELYYQVIDIASGDLGAPAYRKYDIEAYMTMKGDEHNTGDFGEVTSTSNCTDYQARRANIKYHASDGKKAYVHTLNGTAIVTSRLPIALVEQHQQADGSVHIPSALQPYMGKESF